MLDGRCNTRFYPKWVFLRIVRLRGRMGKEVLIGLEDWENPDLILFCSIEENLLT